MDTPFRRDYTKRIAAAEALPDTVKENIFRRFPRAESVQARRVQVPKSNVPCRSAWVYRSIPSRFISC